MPQELTLPAVPQKLVATADDLAELCAHLRALGSFAFDTEFIGENSYLPVLCLIQVATTERVDLIDPLSIDRAAMLPFWQLIADPSIEKSVHAGDQDIEIAWQHSGLVPANMFDTQIGAGMLGIAYPTALWRAVEFFCAVTLEKAHTFSAWDRRPLSKSQFTYAVDDVRFLPHIHNEMKARIAALHHDHWMRDACDTLCREKSQTLDARKKFARIKGASSLDSEQLSVLREITALREQLAFEHDLPARAFLKDDVLLETALRKPRDSFALGGIKGMPRNVAENYRDQFLDAVALGQAVPPSERPQLYVPPEDSADIKRFAEMLWVAAQAICLGQSVTPALVTSQTEVLTLARLLHRNRPVDQHPLLHGWATECLGQKLLAFAAGKLTLDLSLIADSFQAKFATPS